MPDFVRHLLIGAAVAVGVIMVIPAVLGIVFWVLALVGALAIVRKLVLPGARISQIRGIDVRSRTIDGNSND